MHSFSASPNPSRLSEFETYKSENNPFFLPLSDLKPPIDCRVKLKLMNTMLKTICLILYVRDWLILLKINYSELCCPSFAPEMALA